MEDYKVKYEEKINMLKVAIANVESGSQDHLYIDDIKDIFPELKESEDEKIKKYLINFVKVNKDVNLSPDDADRMLAWLEKQGKQKPVEEKSWTIDNAKDGDILSCSADDGSVWLMIFQSEYKPYDGHVHYHALLTEELFVNGTCCIDTNSICPATKEQCISLFDKILKEGYVWDSYSLKLKKIEQKPEWSNEDEKMLDEISRALCKLSQKYRLAQISQK